MSPTASSASQATPYHDDTTSTTSHDTSQDQPSSSTATQRPPPQSNPVIYDKMASFFSTRTAAVDASHIVPFIHSGMSILDVGCGPGSITLDFARLVGPQGRVVGIDIDKGAVETARRAAEVAIAKGEQLNVEFRVVSVFDLLGSTKGDDGKEKDPIFREGTFDVLHAHAVLMHLPTPVAALRIMRRLAHPKSGIIAYRDAVDALLIGGSPLLQKYQSLFERISADRGVDLFSGRYNFVWAREAGFSEEQIATSVQVWEMRTREEKRVWAAVNKGNMVRAARGGGYLSGEEVERVNGDWDVWAEEFGSRFLVVEGSVVCRMG